jgi:hypothetical protein
MPFLNQISGFINDELKAGSLNKEKLQPAKFYGLITIVTRSPKGTAQNQIELLPAIVTADGKATPITPDSKQAIQVYHKLQTNVYSKEKNSYGDAYFIRSVSELTMVVLTNSKITGKTKDALEPVVLHGIPQRLSTALMADLKINSCLIIPVSSNMNHIEVFRQEYPQSDYFLNEQMSMFAIRYKIEMSFSQACIEQCLCE